MREMKWMAVTSVAVLALAVGLAGCGPAFVRVDVPVKRESSVVETGSAESVRARIQMGVGDLEVKPGSGKLMDAELTYRPEGWRPEVDYSVEGTTGTLTVTQPDISGIGLGKGRTDWNLRLDRDVPMDLTVERGVGKTRLDLGELTLRSLTVMVGVGESTIDLSTMPKNDVRVDIQAGVGAVTLRVPREAGVRIFGIHDGVGDWQAEGFTSRGDNAAYNESYDTAKTRFDIHLTRGVGSVRVEQD